MICGILFHIFFRAGWLNHQAEFQQYVLDSGNLIQLLNIGINIADLLRKKWWVSLVMLVYQRV